MSTLEEIRAKFDALQLATDDRKDKFSVAKEKRDEYDVAHADAVEAWSVEKALETEVEQMMVDYVPNTEAPA